MGASFAPCTADASSPMGSTIQSTAPSHPARSTTMSTRSMGVFDMCYRLFRLFQLALVTCLLFLHPSSSYTYQCFTLVNAIVFETTINYCYGRRNWDPGIHWDPGIVLHHNNYSSKTPSGLRAAVTSAASATEADAQRQMYKLSETRCPSTPSRSRITPRDGDPFFYWSPTRRHHLSTSTVGTTPTPTPIGRRVEPLTTALSRATTTTVSKRLPSKTSIKPNTRHIFPWRTTRHSNPCIDASLNFLAVESLIPVLIPFDPTPRRAIKSLSQAPNSRCYRVIEPLIVESSSYCQIIHDVSKKSITTVHSKTVIKPFSLLLLTVNSKGCRVTPSFNPTSKVSKQHAVNSKIVNSNCCRGIQSVYPSLLIPNPTADRLEESEASNLILKPGFQHT